MDFNFPFLEIAAGRLGKRSRRRPAQAANEH
jgi:hypothetical protein